MSWRDDSPATPRRLLMQPTKKTRKGKRPTNKRTALAIIGMIQKAGENVNPDEESIISSINGLSSRVNINGADRAGHTMLTMAAAQGVLRAFQLLLSYGADVHHVQKNGWNSLSSAIFQGHYEVADYIRDNNLLATDQSVRDQVGDERLDVYLSASDSVQ